MPLLSKAFAPTLCLCAMVAGLMGTVDFAKGQRVTERLDRGVIAVPRGEGGVFVSWRLLADDPEGTAFNLYRSSGGALEKVNPAPLSGPTHFVDTNPPIGTTLSYTVRALVGEAEQPASTPFRLDPAHPYLAIPLQTPEGYTPNDASVGDLDGDGAYELVIHQVGRGRDNSQNGVTTSPVFEAYELDGTLLWRIDLGRNIREGAHYTQFMVYDLDGDGRAEVAMKTADGTVDGVGKIIGDPAADHRNEQGHVLAGPEFLTIFDGTTGAARATVPYIPPRHPRKANPAPDELEEIWGDGRGNRSDRFLAAVAYLDGRMPSLIMARGYYTRAVLSAWNYREGRLTNVWTFDSDDGTPGNHAYRGQGNHNLSIGDVDGDGRDEIVYGAAVIDDNGRGLYSTGLGHGDALHFGDLDPSRPGLEIFSIQERFDDAGANFRDARSGQVLWRKASVRAGDDGEGPGRGNSFDIDPRHPGSESWVAGANLNGIWNAKGELISEVQPRAVNFGVWWDGDPLRELLDRNVVYKWDWRTSTMDTLFVAEGALSNNGTKATPALSGDILGDWREEILLRVEDNPRELRLYTTMIPTEYRHTTLLHDSVYRLGLAWQNVAYNQPPHVGYYFADALEP